MDQPDPGQSLAGQANAVNTADNSQGSVGGGWNSKNEYNDGFHIFA